MDTEGTGRGATVVCVTTGRVEPGGLGAAVDGGLGPGLSGVVMAVGEVAAGAGPAECVAASVTLGLAESAGLEPGLDTAPLTGLDAPTIPVGLFGPEAVSWAGRELPDSATTSTAARPTATATAPTAAALLDIRRGLGAVTGRGNPSWPNCPDLCVTEVRWARPAGVSSVQTFMIRPTRASGRIASGADFTGVTGSAGGVPPSAMIRRKHSLRATACSHWPSLAGSRSPSSFIRATTNVSSTTSADSAGGKMLRQ